MCFNFASFLYSFLAIFVVVLIAFIPPFRLLILFCFWGPFCGAVEYGAVAPVLIFQLELLYGLFLPYPRASYLAFILDLTLSWTTSMFSRRYFGPLPRFSYVPRLGFLGYVWVFCYVFWLVCL